MRSGLVKNRILYRRLETNRYLCTIIQNKMGINKLKVVLTEEAQTFWDTEEETLVIATHGIVKKTQKTPLKEI
ncbi:MAG: type II toxin-antitoxin system RelE/ParE family toxin, partial [Prevotella sp.]|nr:type II toxin-antitoxin system RelE/ParE family toxin [Prevotella sp.]